MADLNESGNTKHGHKSYSVEKLEEKIGKFVKQSSILIIL